MLKINIFKKLNEVFSIPLKIVENDRTNKIILFIILIALITTTVIIVSIVVMDLASLEQTGGG